MSAGAMQRTFKMGKVCRICDRKFFLRASFEAYASEIKAYDVQIKQLEDEYDMQEDVHEDLKEQTRLVRKMTCEEEKRHDNLAQMSQEKLLSLRSSETDLRRLSESFTQKISIRKKATHKMKMDITEKEIAKEEASFEVDKASNKLRVSSVLVD